MSARFLLALPLLLSACYAQVQPSPSPHRPPSSAQIYGFAGPIHTSKYTIRELSKDPRSQPKLPIAAAQKTWMVFNESGQLVEAGDLDPAGKVENVVQRSYDANGQQNTTELINGRKITRYELKTATTPDGAIEHKNIINGALQSTVLSRINESKTAGETTLTDSSGTTMSHTRWEQEGSTQTVEAWGQGGKFVLHLQRTTDEDGNITESSRFDETGRMVSTMSFYKGELTSFWQDPGCNCTNSAAFRGSDDSTIFYSTDKAGKLYKEVQRHPGRLTNQEMDADELYDQNGDLLEKLAYSYVRDDRGNWTKRIVSVLDPGTNEMVPVREDTRELSYY